jgi:Flp pilus assembly protein TadD
LTEVDPGEIVGFTGLAETLLRLGREAESDAVVERARRTFGDLPALSILVARRLLRSGDLDGAEDILALLRSGDDDIARAARSWTAALLLARGDFSAALAEAAHTFELDRNDPVATFVAAMSLRRRGDPRALAWLERARRLAPRDSVVVDELEHARMEAKGR